MYGIAASAQAANAGEWYNLAQPATAHAAFKMATTGTGISDAGVSLKAPAGGFGPTTTPQFQPADVILPNAHPGVRAAAANPFSVLLPAVDIGAPTISLPSANISADIYALHSEDTWSSKASAPVTPPKHEPAENRIWMQLQRRPSSKSSKTELVEIKAEPRAEPFMSTGDAGHEGDSISTEEDVKPLQLMIGVSCVQQLSANTARKILATDANRMTVTITNQVRNEKRARKAMRRAARSNQHKGHHVVPTETGTATYIGHPLHQDDERSNEQRHGDVVDAAWCKQNQYPCCYDACDRRFSRPSHLRNHLYTHTGEKPYSCEICSRGFGTNWALTKHVRIHAQEQPYACNMGCAIRFSQRSSWRRHNHAFHAEVDC